MKILILNWKDIKNPDVGGAEIILYELAKRWIKNGYQVTWFCRSFSNALPEEVIDKIKIVRKGNKLTTYLYAFLYYRGLKEKPDLVVDILNTIFWQTPLYVKKTKRLAFVNQLAREVFFYEFPPFVSHLAYFLESLQFKTYKNTPFLCYSKSTKEDLIRVGIPAKNINTFSLGLDHERYFPGEKAKEPLFLCTSRLVKMKRTDLAIRAMKIVVQKYPRAKLAIVGYGYQRQELGRLRGKLHLNDNIFFADENILYFKKSNKDRKIELMQKAWALLFPSVKEGWGMTVTECAACGTPAIVTNVDGLKDSVIKDRTGLVLSKNPTPEELALAIIRIIKDKNLREKLSKNAIEWSQNFNWDKSGNKSLKYL